MRTELGSWRRAWRRVGKTEVEVEVDADMVEEKLEEEAEEEEEEEAEDNSSDKIQQPSPGRWGKTPKVFFFNVCFANSGQLPPVQMAPAPHRRCQRSQRIAMAQKWQGWQG